MSLLWSDLAGCPGAVHSFTDDREPPEAFLRRKRKEGRQTEGVKEQAEGERGGLIRGLYRKTLEEMQAVGGDSAYFTGEIVFKQVINEKGSVERSEILSSSTNMPKFDQEVKDLVDAVKFPKSNGKTVVTFPYRFEKTGYPRGHIDTTIGTL